jgi:hypothetical protein
VTGGTARQRTALWPPDAAQLDVDTMILNSGLYGQPQLRTADVTRLYAAVSTHRQ